VAFILASLSAQAKMLEDFLALSKILTGVQTLDAALASQYLDRLNSTPFAPLLTQIIARFQTLKPGPTLPDQVKQQILNDDSLRPAITQIVLLWYTSAMLDNPGPPPNFRYGTQEEYFSGLAWQIMGAHVPGLSGGYFGHWRYRPDNEPKEAK
jgi:Membrane bound FAD containing D-sorbitol dehydrogenase